MDAYTMIDLGLHIPKYDVLVIGDLHIGYEEYLTTKGILIPKFHIKELLEKLNKMIHIAKPKTIVINGDIKHEFEKISDEEWRNTLKVIDTLSAHALLILIKGNHDTILGPIAKKRNVRIMDHVSFGEYFICHGDKLPLKKEYAKAKIVIIGHEHPAVSINDGIRKETYKCFLVGTYYKKKIIVMPSMNLVTEGTNILSEKLMSPFLKDIGSFRVFISAEEIYDFGLVKNLQKTKTI